MQLRACWSSDEEWKISQIGSFPPWVDCVWRLAHIDGARHLIPEWLIVDRFEFVYAEKPHEDNDRNSGLFMRWCLNDTSDCWSYTSQWKKTRTSVWHSYLIFFYSNRNVYWWLSFSSILPLMTWHILFCLVFDFTNKIIRLQFGVNSFTEVYPWALASPRQGFYFFIGKTG